MITISCFLTLIYRGNTLFCLTKKFYAMNYEKLTILPCHDPEEAKSIFETLIYEEAYLLLVVLGKDSSAKRILELGTKAAGNKQDPSMVVWISEPEVVADTLSNLQDPKRFLNNLSSIRAFALSITDKVVDVIKVQEKPLNILRVWKSFMLALKG